MHDPLEIDHITKVLGAGSFGIVISVAAANAYKLFYDIRSSAAIVREARIQERARALLQGIVNVPRIHNIYNEQVSYKSQEHLCGLEMDRVPIPEQFDHQVHILLGYQDDDIDSVWSRDYRNPVSEVNPARGFYAGPEMMEAIWEDEGCGMTISDVAYTMGRAYSMLLAGGIIPYDVEWIYGGQGQLYLIDFGLCEEGVMSKKSFLEGGSSQSIAADYYVPCRGFRAYDDFLRGYKT